MKVYKSKKELIEDLISKEDVVLDVGFWGQAVDVKNPDWVHNMILARAKNVFGVDLRFEDEFLVNKENYRKQSAENFSFEERSDIIFAADLIEHLSNPGLFLDSCRKNLKSDGRLIITTPNTFTLYNFVEKFFKKEPSVNNDHTMYFNFSVLRKLLEKNGWEVEKENYLDYTWSKYKISLKRRILFILYKFIGLFTSKFIEDIVVVAKIK